MQLLPSKQMMSYSLNLRQAYTVFIGALARLDFLSGDDKYITFIVPPHVTLHKTPTLKAEDIYAKHAGTLLRPAYDVENETVDFVKHEIAINCNDFKEANFDISIEGLGWFSL
jgi:30S ribosome assembly GTPase